MSDSIAPTSLAPPPDPMEQDSSQTADSSAMGPPRLAIKLGSGTMESLQKLQEDLRAMTMNASTEAGFEQPGLNSLGDAIGTGVRLAAERLKMWLAASSLCSEERCDFFGPSQALIALDRYPFEKTVDANTERFRVKYSFDCIPNEHSEADDQEMLDPEDDDRPANYSAECDMSFALKRPSSETGWKMLPRSIRLTVDNVQINHEALLSALDPRSGYISPTDKNVILDDLLSGVELEAALRGPEDLSALQPEAMTTIEVWESDMTDSVVGPLKRLGIQNDCVLAGCMQLGRQLTGYIPVSALRDRQWTIRTTTNHEPKIYGISSSGDWQLLQTAQQRTQQRSQQRGRRPVQQPDQRSQSSQVLVEYITNLVHGDNRTDPERESEAQTCPLTARLVFTRTLDETWEVDPLRTQLSVGLAEVRMIRNGSQSDPLA